jgi:N-acetylglutamate synthase-like GNAT family acetyltransferase
MPTIRAATLNDHRAIRRLLEGARFDASSIWTDEIKPGLDGDDDDCCCAVYVTSNTVVGVIVWSKGRPAEIRWVAVHKDYQSTGHGTGSGIGKELVKHVTAVSSKTKVEYRPEVESWYRRQGFETDSTDAENALMKKTKQRRRR